MTNSDAILWTRKLLDEEGIFAGVSSGAIARVAVRIAGELDEGNVVIVADDGWKYLSSGSTPVRSRRSRTWTPPSGGERWTSPPPLEEVVVHAREETPRSSDVAWSSFESPPRTGCGCSWARNTAESPLRFEIDGLEVLRLISTIESSGRELGAIYHSHTRTAPEPSQTDINFATGWPGVEWIIVGLADPAAPEIRSFLIDGGKVQEVNIG